MHDYKRKIIRDYVAIFVFQNVNLILTRKKIRIEIILKHANRLESI